MQTTFREIDQIVNPMKFQKIQDDFAAATDLAFITVDYLGRPLTRHSNCSEFCQKVRASKHGVYCEKCDSHGGLEAARIHRPYLYTCHAGLVDFAIPILINDLYLGAFMAGQVLLAAEDMDLEPEHILPNVNDPITSINDDLKASYDKLPVMRFEKIIALANMLLHIGNYCIEEAELKSLLSQYSKTSASVSSKYGTETEEYGRIQTINRLHKKETNQIIAPALQYIKKNPQESITLEKMAALCNISPSYFSKLFAKMNQGSLSYYVNQQKIDHAKELLHSTDWSVRTISEYLGYDDCGYFIKLFKKETKCTPLEYRSHS
jgi:ligand-binding sensor protein/AraC-like DNA-binding protein